MKILTLRITALELSMVIDGCGDGGTAGDVGGAQCRGRAHGANAAGDGADAAVGAGCRSWGTHAGTHGPVLRRARHLRRTRHRAP